MRIVNRLLAFIVAVALFGTSVIIIVEVIAARSGSAPLIIHWHSILHWGQRNTWRATSVELASAATAAAGLIILLPQRLPRRSSRLSIDPGDTSEGAGDGRSAHHHTDVALTRKGVAVSIRGAVEAVEGVTGSRVKVGRRRIRVAAISSAAEPDTARRLEPLVEDAANQQLDALRLRGAHRVHVAVSKRRNGVQ